MQAQLYIIAESFKSNSNYSDSQIEDKINRLAIDVTEITKHKKENKLHANFKDIYPLNFHSKYTIEDFLCRPAEVKKTVDRDVVNALQNIFEKASDTSISSNEVIEILLKWHEKTICHGLIAFHKIEEINEDVQLIYGIDGWYKFRRYFLGLYPDEDKFIEECSKYFPNLYFHTRNTITTKDILADFAISIVKHLGYLNDIFVSFRYREFPNESVKYKTFTSECKLEADAASKDTNDRKSNLIFEFTDKNGLIVPVTCYPHLRLCRSDKYPDDVTYYQHRVYFHEGMERVQNGKILIGHIGLHL